MIKWIYDTTCMTLTDDLNRFEIYYLCKTETMNYKTWFKYTMSNKIKKQ